MGISMCGTARRWPGQVIRVVIVIVIAAAAGRWWPAAVVPLIAGVVLAAGLLASAPRGADVPVVTAGR